MYDLHSTIFQQVAQKWSIKNVLPNRIQKMEAVVIDGYDRG
jgi:hypothetical protein